MSDPAVPLPAAPEDPAPPRRPALAIRLARALTARGIGPGVLASAAVLCAAIGGFCILVRHPGLGGVLGLLALGAGSLAGAEPTSGPARAARGLALAADWLILGAVVAQAAASHLLLRLLLGLGVLGLHGWLPELRTRAPDGPAAPGTGLWRRAERVAMVLLGLILGPVEVALVLVAAVGLLDAVFRLGRLGGDPSRMWRPAVIRPLVTEDGDLEPVVRWGSLILAALVLLVLSRLLAPDGGWPF